MFEPAFPTLPIERVFSTLAAFGEYLLNLFANSFITQDGRVAKKLIGQDSKIEKEYLVRVTGTIIENGMELLQYGLELDGKPLKPAKVSWINEDQLRIVLREGKKRQIRRMCDLVNLKVTGLKRVRVGQVKLAKLPIGQWRYLGDKELF